MYKIRELYQNSETVSDFVRGYGLHLNKLMNDLDAGNVAKLIEVIEKTCQENGTIFVIGNGGSSAAASHFMNDLGPNTLIANQPGFRVLSLTDNVESVTAIANDAGFENIFIYQLQAHMRPGDIVLALSVSGNSENIFRGVQYAKEYGGYTIGWTGFDGGRLKEICDLCIHIPTTKDEYGPVEDIFSILGHIISSYLTMKRGRNLHH